MRVPGRTTLVTLALLAATVPFVLAGEARACAPLEEPPAKPPTEADKALAVELFAQGKELEKAGDIERALEKFLASRALVPRKSSTKNAAHCLDMLGRSDEALAMYERVLADYPNELSADEHATIRKGVIELRRHVATVRFEEGAGALTIDGKPCGELPREKPLYVLPGNRRLRVSTKGSPGRSQVLPLNEGETLIVRFSERDDKPVDDQPPPPPQPAPKPIPGWFAEVFLGPAIGPAFREGAWQAGNEICTGECGVFSGVFFDVHGGYRTKLGVSVELSTGFLSASSSFELNGSLDFATKFLDTKTIVYSTKNLLSLAGPFMGGALGYERRLSTNVSLLARTAVGIIGIQSGNLPDATLRGSDATTNGGSATVASIPAFVMPELGIALRSGKVALGASLGLFFITIEGPVMPRLVFKATNGPGFLDNATRTAYEPMVLFIPRISISFPP